MTTPHPDPPPPQPPSATTDIPTQPKQTYTYYHGGPLFTLADLSTNIALSNLIATLSQNRFQAILPQDLEPRPTPSSSSASIPSSTTTPSTAPTPHTIRDTDLSALLSADLALFIYDGAELDAGTVVEYIYAKAADIPSVILRTDFRGGGDQGPDLDGAGTDKWNLMSSNWPRTKGVRVDSMAGYKERLASESSDGEEIGLSGRVNKRAAEGLLHETARRVVQAMEEVVALPPRLPRELRGAVYEWLALMPGLKDGGDEGNVRWARGLLEGKVGKGLL